MRTQAVTRADSDALLRRWQKHGDRDARDELVDRWLPFARTLARRYRGTHESVEDLTQVANLALLKAIDRFDPERGCAFASFAAPTILGELKRHLHNVGWSVRVPRRAQDRALKVQRGQRQLVARTGRVPSIGQLAEHVELSVEEVLDALEIASAHHSTSLQAARTDGDGEPVTLADLLGECDERFERVEASEQDRASHWPAVRS